MDEKDVEKFMPKVFLFGLIIWVIIGLFTKKISYPLGWMIGYVISILSFKLIIRFTDMVLTSKQAVMPVVLLFVLKTVLYIAGFMLAIIWKDYFNLISVFLGYFITNVSIQILGRKHRGGEMSV